MRERLTWVGLALGGLLALSGCSCSDDTEVAHGAGFVDAGEDAADAGEDGDAGDAAGDAGNGDAGDAGDAGDGCLAFETCNGIDDDCDGETDEGDPGGGESCSTGLEGACAVGTSVCRGGALECIPDVQPVTEICNDFDDDCNGVLDDVADLAAECGALHAGAVHVSQWVCAAGSCEIDTCEAGFADCDGQVANGCEVDSENDVEHCGGCARACPAVNGTPACVAGSCGIVCAAGFADCDADPSSGCEVNISVSTQHCGGCGQLCSGSCVGGVCDTSCPAGFADCDGDPANGCEVNVISDVNNCGGCGAACTNPNGSTACVNGACTPTCATGFGNCDGDATNGCETATTVYYRDVDGDQHGDANEPRAACSQPAGYVALGGDCDDGDAARFPGNPEICDQKDNDCNGRVDDVAGCCQASVDADFDGSNQCDDCDDSNGSVFPGATERCNGIDDDCDGLTDEDFDADQDTYTTCASDPVLVDCDDGNPDVNPGQLENCGATGQGNGIDDDCNGFVDEGCQPCNPLDTDGDGVPECSGDCAPDDPNRYPGNPEVCDGLDNDCNLNTIDNCSVSEPCNFDQDGNPANDFDVCEDDLICACVVGQSGRCTGDYLCTSFCNTSKTGPTGDGCSANAYCAYDLLRSANVHGCAVTTTTLGTKAGGEACSGDAECRSGNCSRLCVGPGCATSEYCMDWCASDAYCSAPNTVCRVSQTGSVTDGNVDGRCWPAGGPLLGSTPVGGSCTTSSSCDHGICVNGICSKACCRDSDCPGGFTCSLDGTQSATNYVATVDGSSCGSDAECDTGICFQGECAYRLVETTPLCLPDASGQGTRPAGAACAANAECLSNFCEKNLGVCVDVCCNDSTCPTGLTCELQTVEVAPGSTGEGRATGARVCVNLSSDSVFEKM